MTNAPTLPPTPFVTKEMWSNEMPWDLEPEYCMWVGQLTKQGLHAKADIATVLAIYERELTTLRAQLAEQTARADACERTLNAHHDAYPCHICGGVCTAALAKS